MSVEQDRPIAEKSEINYGLLGSAMNALDLLNQFKSDRTQIQLFRDAFYVSEREAFVRIGYIESMLKAGIASLIGQDQIAQSDYIQKEGNELEVVRRHGQSRLDEIVVRCRPLDFENDRKTILRFELWIAPSKNWNEKILKGPMRPRRTMELRYGNNYGETVGYNTWFEYVSIMPDGEFKGFLELNGRFYGNKLKH
jgi:hypothetical protein